MYQQFAFRWSDTFELCDGHVSIPHRQCINLPNGELNPNFNSEEVVPIPHRQCINITPLANNVLKTKIVSIPDREGINLIMIKGIIIGILIVSIPDREGINVLYRLMKNILRKARRVSIPDREGINVDDVRMLAEVNYCVNS